MFSAPELASEVALHFGDGRQIGPGVTVEEVGERLGGDIELGGDLVCGGLLVLWEPVFDVLGGSDDYALRDVRLYGGVGREVAVGPFAALCDVVAWPVALLVAGHCL